MCLAIPMRIEKLLDNGLAEVSALGATRTASLDFTPLAEPGDYVLVHAGFAIEVVDAAYAAETIDLIQEMTDMFDEGVSL